MYGGCQLSSGECLFDLSPDSDAYLGVLGRAWAGHQSSEAPVFSRQLWRVNVLTYTKHVEYSTCPRADTRGQGVLGTVSVTLTCPVASMSLHLPGLEAAAKRNNIALS